MKFLVAAVALCLVTCSFATVLAPYGAAVAPLGVAHYASVPVGRAVAYGSTIHHGVIGGIAHHGGLGLAPYGLRYGLGAPVAAVKYGVHAAPLAAVKYGVHAAPLAVAPAYGLGLSKGLIL